MRGALSFVLWCWLGACAAEAARAQPAIQPLETIRAAAEQQVRRAITSSSATVFVTADRLDERLRLQRCAGALTAFLPSGANLGTRTTVGVRCEQGTTWTVYVPVSVETELPVLVLRSAIARNSPVTAQDVELQTRRVKGPSVAYLTQVEQLKGMHAKHTLPMGTLLTPDGLAPDILVKRGQQVILLAMVGGIEVRANGVALTEGGATSRVRVQNLSSLKVVEGTVATDSTVRVTL